MEQINRTLLEKIDKIHGTPFYLMNGKEYLHNLQKFQDAFTQRYNKLIIGYSFKTNYVPTLCKIAHKAGCYAEVVSEMEYDLAKQLGFNNIIFNGPIKKTEILEKALIDKAIINLDSSYEIEKIINYKKTHPKEEIGIGLRLNIDLSNEEGVSKVQCGLRVGRFGFTKELLQDIIPMLHKNGIKIISLHGHTSSSDRAVENYSFITKQMLQVCKYFQLNDLKYFDVGGGFFGAAAKGIDTSHKPKYIDYANCILDICTTNKWFNTINPWIVIEPGVSVVANVFSYVSKIFQTKEIAGQKFLITDGSVYDVKPTLHTNNLPHTFYTKKKSEHTYTADLVGSTCMEKDIILKNISAPNSINHGDYVKIEGVGAYTIVLTPTFINYLSPIIEIEDDKTNIIRRRQTLNDVTSLYTL